MNLGDKLNEIIEEGKRGDNRGLSFGDIPNLAKAIPLIQRGKIITILGGTGSGKSTLGINHFGFEPFMDYYRNHRSNPNYVFKWFINSLEMDLKMLITRMASYILMRDYGLSISVVAMMGMNGESIPPDIEELIKVEIAPTLNELSQYVEITHKVTSAQVERKLYDFYGQHGTIMRDKHAEVTGYTTDKFIFVLVTHDHVALTSGDGSKKSKIDELSSMEIEMKNLFGTTFINLQQLNRGESDITKLTKMDNPKPYLSEAKDSGDLIDASDVVIMLFIPYRFSLNVYMDIDIAATPLGLKDAYRALFVEKNRSGKTGYVHCAFYGMAGLFRQIPDDLTDKIKLKIRNAQPFWR